MTYVLWFVVAIAILVAVHEFGHFWVARKLGVKVLRFSIGFGRPLLSWTGKGPDCTEYCIAAIPLGGYVKMLDEAEGDVAPEELERAFNRQRLPVRMAVVVAGPLFNFLFAVAAYWLMFSLGVPGIRPMVEEVRAGSVAAEAGVLAGDEFTRVQGREVRSWQNVAEAMIASALEGGELLVSVRGEDGRARDLTFGATPLVLDEVADGRLLAVLGVVPARAPAPAVLGDVVEDSPAARAGFASGDRLLELDGEAIGNWYDLVRLVRARPGATVDVDLERDGVPRTLVITIGVVESAGGSYGRIGAHGAPAPRDIVEAFFERHEHTIRYGPLDALARAAERTGEMTTLTLRMLWKMVRFEVSVKNLSGPISIAQYAGASAERGFIAFLGFLAIVSISLGILNLLPIPLLDGGHLMYYVVELFTGRPVSDEVQFIGQRLGIAMLVGLMSVAFYNDLARLFG